MAFLLLTWLIVGCLWWAIGQGLFAGLGIQNHPRDRPLETIGVKLLLGMSLTGLVWYVVALWTPLTPGVAIATLALMLFISYRLHPWPWLQFPRQPPDWLGGFVLLAVVTAWFMSQRITAYDTGYYHYPALKWLAHYGAVPGLALFNFLLAYPSSWLALSAPFEALLPGRAGTAISGITVLMTVAKLGPTLVRLQHRQGAFLDWFWLLSSAFGLGLLCHFGLPISPSPDVGVVCLGLWLIFTWVRCIPEPLSRQDLVPLGLAIAAFGCKTSALPLLVGVVLWLLVRYRQRWRTVLAILAGTGIATSPLLLFGWQTSGCPIFPTPLFCLEQLPWSIGAAQAHSLSKIIQDGARWQFIADPPTQYTWLNWFVPWLFKQRRATFLLLCNSFIALIALGRAGQKARRLRLAAADRGAIAQAILSPYWSLWVLVLLGTTLVLFGSPNIRFGIVYLSIVPALWGARLCAARSRWRWLNFWLVGLSINLWLQPSLTLAVLLVVLVVLSVFWQQFSKQIPAPMFIATLLVLTTGITIKISVTEFDYQLNWLWPAPIESINDVAIVKQQRNDIVYFAPDPDFRWQRWPDRLGREDRCWDALPPCTPEVTVPELQLRHPAQGVQGGFVRSTAPVQ